MHICTVRVQIPSYFLQTHILRDRMEFFSYYTFLTPSHETCVNMANLYPRQHSITLYQLNEIGN